MTKTVLAFTAMLHRPSSSSGTAALLLLALFPVSAHAAGTLVVMFGSPVAIVTFLVAAGIARRFFSDIRGWLYWPLVILGLVPWLGIYLYGASVVLDSRIVETWLRKLDGPFDPADCCAAAARIPAEYRAEQFVGLFLACLPLFAAVIARVVAAWRSRQATVRSQDQQESSCNEP